MIAARIRHVFAPLVLIAALSVTPLKATTTPSKVVSREIQSINFTQSKIGVSPTRRMVVYLPAGYDESQKRYPVIYFFPTPSTATATFSTTRMRKAFLTGRSRRA